MNVLFLSQFFSTTRGGGEHLFHIIAKQLAKHDHKVWIITNRIKDENYEDFENIKIEFVPPELEYKGGLPPSFSDNFRFLFSSINSGLKIIKKEKIDIIHSNNFTPALAGGILSYLTSKPHITSIWDVFSLCGENYWKQWAKQMNVSKINAMIGPFFEKLVLKVPCKVIHTISNATENDLLKFGATKPIYVIRPILEDIPQRNVDISSKQFIYVGRLIFYKNLEVVIKAFDIIRRTESDAKLLIVGDGPQRQQLQRFVKKLGLEKNIDLKGYVSNEEKMELIAGSNSLIFPSLCEGFGLVILEAFSQKKPVLASSMAPMSEIIENNHTGFLLDPQNVNDWAEKMIHLIKNPEIASKIGNNGYGNLQKHTLEKMYEKILAMYDDVIKKN